MAEYFKEQPIILAFTGPVGSGCSTISEYFDKDENQNKSITENEFIEFLIKNEYLNKDCSDVNIQKWDFEVERLYEERMEIIKKINKEKVDIEIIKEKKVSVDKFTLLKKQKRIAKLSEVEKNLHSELKEILEKREHLRALKNICSYLGKDKNYNFRKITVSDLIMFRVLLMTEEVIKNNILPLQYLTGEKEFLFSFFKGYCEKLLVELQKSEDELERLELNLGFRNLNASDKMLLARLHERLDRLGNFSLNKFSREKEGQLNIERYIDLLTNLIKNVLLMVKEAKKQMIEERGSEDYRALMQDFGDNLRSKGQPLNFKKIVDLGDRDDINSIRENCNILAKEVKILVSFLSLRRNYSFFLIDALRNPSEVRYLRSVFTKIFLISVYASFDERKNRIRKVYELKKKEFKDVDFENNEKRDRGETISQPLESLYMQNVSECVKMSDISINSVNVKREELRDYLCEKLIRYLALIFEPGSTKPSKKELFMNLAYTIAMRSNCISRQVGAIIVKNDYIAGAGYNDVGEGQISCGLREIKDLKLPNFREYIEALGFNKEQQKDAIDFISGQFKEDYFCFCFREQMQKKDNADNLKKALQKIRQVGNFNDKHLVELSRILESEFKAKLLQNCKALHAEENAIIQNSKIGGMGLRGSTIYVTASPCELCSKKINQVGISKVIYTEPYPSRLSESIFLKDGIHQVENEHFEGVMPYSYFRLFKPDIEQKEWQNLLHYERI